MTCFAFLGKRVFLFVRGQSRVFSDVPFLHRILVKCSCDVLYLSLHPRFVVCPVLDGVAVLCRQRNINGCGVPYEFFVLFFLFFFFKLFIDFLLWCVGCRVVCAQPCRDDKIARANVPVLTPFLVVRLQPPHV